MVHDVVLQLTYSKHVYRLQQLAAADARGEVSFLPTFLKGVEVTYGGPQEHANLVMLHDVLEPPAQLLEWLRGSTLSKLVHRVLFLAPRSGRPAAPSLEVRDSVRSVCVWSSGMHVFVKCALLHPRVGPAPAATVARGTAGAASRLPGLPPVTRTPIALPAARILPYRCAGLGA